MMLHKRYNFKFFYFFRGNFWIFFISRMFRKITSNDSCNYFVLRKATEWKVILSYHHFIAFINDPAFPEFWKSFSFHCEKQAMRKLCLFAKFPHQEISWNYGIFRSVQGWSNNSWRVSFCLLLCVITCLDLSQCKDS